MVLAYQQLRDAIQGKAPIISAPPKYPIDIKQVQPASLDLRLGEKAYRTRAASLPRDDQFVFDLISTEPHKKYDFDLSTKKSNMLEKNHTYVIPLLEACALPEHVWIEFSPKSSTGRCDVFARVLCDRFPHYDVTPPGYHGPLYLEVTPLSFDVEIRQGLSLMQGRLKTKKTLRLDDEEIAQLHMKEGILFGTMGRALSQKELRIRNRELFYHVDLDRDVVGLMAKSSFDSSLRMDLDPEKDPLEEPRNFWEPIQRPRGGVLTLIPGNFYLLATKERTKIPSTVCGQVTSYELTTGEFRPHYAGFFDPGFGNPQEGTKGVLEVRARDVPYNLTDGKPICSMKFERMSELPEVTYAGNYRESGPSLSKHFDHRYTAWESGYWRGLW